MDATTVEKIDLPNEDQTHVAFEEKNLLQLNDIDPFTQKVHIDNFIVMYCFHLLYHISKPTILYFFILKGERYQCTVTIIGIPNKQHWCYHACRVCSSKMISTPDGFRCTKDGGCPSKTTLVLSCLSCMLIKDDINT